jgi:uracil-DNA glycosylase
VRLQNLLKETSWIGALENEFDEPYMQKLELFLNEEISKGKTIYPQENDIFNALNFVPLDQVKVIILGQDPYHGQGQFHGLSFSVKPGIPIPPSLRNIYKELNSDLSISPVKHGYLKEWCDQGVLLLNTTLTVEQSLAGSHYKKGWEKFTDSIIRIINQNNPQVVFLLWGSPSRMKKTLINKSKHLILEAPHPSPLSAYRGFFGCRHFSQANDFLKKHNMSAIDWQLSENI